MTYLYLLNDHPASELQVYYDTHNNPWVEVRYGHSACVDEWPTLQEYIDGLQNE